MEKYLEMLPMAYYVIADKLILKKISRRQKSVKQLSSTQS